MKWQKSFSLSFGEGWVVRLRLPDSDEVRPSSVNEEKSAGTYEVEFSVGRDSSPDIASRIYFYQLQAGDFSQTKNMILIQ